MRDIKNNFDDFAEFLAEALEPVCRIAADPAVAAVFRENKPVITLAKPLLRDHREDVAAILAAMKGETVADFKADFDAVCAMKDLLSLLARPEIKAVFHSAEQTEGATSSGSASENTGE